MRRSGKDDGLPLHEIETFAGWDPPTPNGKPINVTLALLSRTCSGIELRKNKAAIISKNGSLWLVKAVTVEEVVDRSENGRLSNNARKRNENPAEALDKLAKGIL